jgi:hypothetical protein
VSSLRTLSLLVALAALATGCVDPGTFQEVREARVALGLRGSSSSLVARGSLAAKGPLDRYVAMAGAKKPPAVGLAFVQTTPDTWGPFDVSLRTGFFDPEQMQNPLGVRVCLEVDSVGFSVFYDVCGLFGPTGWNVSAFTNLGLLTGNVLIDADEIELRVEQTGMTVNFYAREAGAPVWSAVANTAFPTQTLPLKAAFGVTGLSKGTEVGFDDLEYASSAPPMAPTGAVAVAADVNAALLAGYAAFRALDGGAPDFGAAAASLDDADAALDDAMAGVAALPSSKTNQSAAKQLAKADKGLTKAQDQVAGQAADKALKTLGKAGDSLVEAALLLNPQPL